MKSSVILLCVAFCFALPAAVIDRSCSIVIPKPGGDPVLNRFDRLAADLFAEGASKSAGVTLPVFSEDQFKGGRAIFIGDTAAARKLGLNPKTFRYNECRGKSDGKGNLFLSGRDAADPGYPQANHHRFREMGTLRGVCEFLREYAGMRVFLPGKDGRHFQKKEKLEFPDDLDRLYTPAFLYVTGRPGGDPVYDTANGFLSSPWNKSYGGHSHPVAVPTSLYEKHPEYFLQTRNGKRWKGVQYCLSNPEVQELIYQEMLKQLDRGFDWVQLAQTDGFSPCSCGPCQKLYGISDWGEKMWILHRRMAERLQKERPGKKAVILCYSPNADAPKSFREFPDNVVVELCRYTEKELDAWQKIKVPGGLVAYVYNWGAFGPQGYTPRFTPEKSVEQIRLLKKYGIRGIYRCGFGEMFGLCGPDYYAYAGAVNDPEHADAEKLLTDYCDSLYGKAAPAMKKFHRALYDRQQVELKDKHDDYHRNLSGGMPGGYANHRLIALRYPPATVAALDAELRGAEAAEPENNFVKLVRREFDFLAVTAAMCHAFMEYIAAPSPASFAAMKRGVEIREKYLTEAPQVRGHLTHTGGVPTLGGIPVKTLREGGNWKAKFLYPLNWDLNWMIREGIVPGARKLFCGAPAQKLLPAYFGPVAEEMATVRAEELPEGIQVVLNVPGVTKAEMFYVIFHDTLYVFRNTYKNADIYVKKDGKTTTNPEKALTRISSSGDQIACFIPWSLLPGGRTAAETKGILFNIYRKRQKDNAEFVYEPDLKILDGRRSTSAGRGILLLGNPAK